MGKVQLEELEKHGRYFSVPQGVSMMPMIHNKKGVVEVRKLEGEAKRYDLVLYIRGAEQGVIHRVLRVRDKDYIIAGDNCWRKEYVPKEKVVGIIRSFYRNGKWYDVSDRGYQLYAHLWTDLFCIRRPVFYARDRIQAVFRRLRRKSGNR